MINDLKDKNISSLCTVFPRSFAPVYILIYYISLDFFFGGGGNLHSVSFLPTFLVQKTPNLSKVDFYVLEHVSLKKSFLAFVKKSL